MGTALFLLSLLVGMATATAETGYTKIITDPWERLCAKAPYHGGDLVTLDQAKALEELGWLHVLFVPDAAAELVNGACRERAEQP